MPRGKKVSVADRKELALERDAARELPREKIPDSLDITPDDIRTWEKDLIPDGSGLPAQRKYETMDVVQIEMEFQKVHALAKMYLIERITKLAPSERDLSKVSGALRDLNNIVAEGESPGSKKDSWSDYVMQAIGKIQKERGPVQVNVIQNQQINNGKGSDSD